ncbi:MAG: biotin--[acetyl-CoA-carboxylase] ligase, partial [Burkholderiaceae bacterium]
MGLHRAALFAGRHMSELLHFEQVETIDSTNAELMRRPWHQDSDNTPVALWAQQQTAGRGRMGRVWQAPAQDAITLSVGLDLAAPVSALVGLPIAVGVALADVLQDYGARLWLKWPNDLYTGPVADVGPMKVGGILTEVKALDPSARPGMHRVVTGFGLNLFAAPTGLSQPAAAIFGPDSKVRPDRPDLARALALRVADVLCRFPREGLGPWRAGWQARDLLAGRPITIHHPDGRCEAARAQGIDIQGGLKIIDAQG